MPLCEIGGFGLSRPCSRVPRRQGCFPRLRHLAVVPPVHRQWRRTLRARNCGSRRLVAFSHAQLLALASLLLCANDTNRGGPATKNSLARGVTPGLLPLYFLKKGPSYAREVLDQGGSYGHSQSDAQASAAAARIGATTFGSQGTRDHGR